MTSHENNNTDSFDSEESTGGGYGNGGDDWCLIESDPGVFTELLESLGCPHVELHELWSLDDDALLLEKVYGLVFLFQWTKDRQVSHANLAETTVPEGMWFGRQVATNACATQAILSILLNAAAAGTNDDEEGNPTSSSSSSSSAVEFLGQTLSEFREFTRDFSAQIKGVSIASSEELRKAHNAFCSPDSIFDDGTSPKNANSKKDAAEAFHFVAYIPFRGTVYELDGLMPGPIAVGEIANQDDDDNDTDGTSATTPQRRSSTSTSWIATAKSAIQARMANLPTEKFNLMAVIADKRMNPHITPEDLQAEHHKRAIYKLENERRRHNYIPLVVQLAKELARQKKLPLLVRQAKERKKAKREQAAKNLTTKKDQEPKEATTMEE